MQQNSFYIEQRGFERNDNGLLQIPLDALSSLYEWHKRTSPGGIMMASPELFDTKVLVNASLFPQIKDDKVQYLFGKGVGTELALQGNIEGKYRKKNFKLRNHADFELYGLLIGSKYPDEYVEVFGHMEGRDETKTKSLEGIPIGEMNQRKLTVEYKGVKYLIPELELLFLDKFLMPESTPRAEGYDHELLALAYDLNWDLIHEYLDKYYIEYRIEEDETYYSGMDVLSTYKFKFTDLYNTFKTRTLPKRGIVNPSKEIIIQAMLDNYITPLKESLGIETLRDFWVTPDTEDIDEDGNIVSESYEEKIKENILNYKKKKIDKYYSLHSEIDELRAMVEGKIPLNLGRKDNIVHEPTVVADSNDAKDDSTRPAPFVFRFD